MIDDYATSKRLSIWLNPTSSGHYERCCFRAIECQQRVVHYFNHYLFHPPTFFPLHRVLFYRRNAQIKNQIYHQKSITAPKT